jgi:beta-1,4-mannosyltransferase
MMRPPPALPKSAPKIVFLLYAPFKVLYQVVQMVWTLSFSVSRPSHILIQVGPTPLPTLMQASSKLPKVAKI